MCSLVDDDIFSLITKGWKRQLLQACKG